MKCPKCGSEKIPDVGFRCPKCGYKYTQKEIIEMELEWEKLAKEKNEYESVLSSL